MRIFEAGGRHRVASTKSRAPALLDRHTRGPALPAVQRVRGPAGPSPARDLLAVTVAWLTAPDTRPPEGSVRARAAREADLRVTDPGWRLRDGPRARLLDVDARNVDPPEVDILDDPPKLEAEVRACAVTTEPARNAPGRDEEAARRDARGEDQHEQEEAAKREREELEVREVDRHADAAAHLAAGAQRPRLADVRATDQSRLDEAMREAEGAGDDLGRDRPTLAQRQPAPTDVTTASPVKVDVAGPTDDAGAPLRPGATAGDGLPLDPEDDKAAARAQEQRRALDKPPRLAPPDVKATAADAGAGGGLSPTGATPPGAKPAPFEMKLPATPAKGAPAAPGEGKPKGDAKAPTKVAAPTGRPSGAPAADAAGSNVPGDAAAAAADNAPSAAVTAWKGRVGGATNQIKERHVPDSAIYIAPIHKAAADPNAVRAARLKRLDDEGKKALTPAKNPPENKVAIPDDPTHKASQLVDVRCGLKIEIDPKETTLPDLQESPQHHVPVIGARVGVDKAGFEFVELPPVEGEKGAQPVIIYKPGGVPPLDEKKRKKWDELQKSLAAAPTSTKRALGKGVTVKEENAPAPTEVPDFAKVDIGDVLARLLAEPDDYAKQTFDEAKKSFYNNVLAEINNTTIGTGLAAAEAPAFAAELQRIAEAAGIKKEALDGKVEQRRKALREDKEKKHGALSDAHETAKKDIAESGKQFLDTVATIRSRLDDEGERRAAAAKGGVDIEELRKRRAAMEAAIGDKVAKWVVIYDGNGKRFKQGLDKAKAEQMQAYQVAAKQDEWDLKKDAGDDKTKLLAAQKTYDETTKVWLQQRQKEIDKVIAPAKRKIDKTIEKYQDDLRQAERDGHEVIRDWYNKSIGYERSWWQQFLDWIFSLVAQNKRESMAWEKARAAETNEAINKDMNFLAEIRLEKGEELDEASIDRRRDLGEEQKAILKEYYKKGGKDAVQALAAGVATRIRLQRQPEIVKALEKEVTDSNDLDLLVAVGNKQTPGFKGKYFLLADEIHVAVRGWGTDEDAIFKALGGLTRIQAKAIELDYEKRYHENMRARLESELNDWVSTSHDWDHAQALLAGDKTMAAAVELNQAMEGTFLGTGWGTDEDKIFSILRGKSPEEIDAIKKAYKSKYGRDLEEHLHDELSSGLGETQHDVDEMHALMSDKPEEAQAIEMDRAMRGTFLGTGWGTDRKAMEGVYDRIKKDVEAEGQRNGWTAKMIREEIARRNAGLDGAYEKRYGADWTSREKGESALHAAFRDDMSGSDLKLIEGMADQDWRKVDAARVQLEHESIFYADDKVIRDAMTAQYRRDIADAKIDGYLDVDRNIAVEKELDWAHTRSEPPPLTKEERAKGMISETDFLDRWRADKTAERRRNDRKGIDKAAEASAQAKAKGNIDALAAQFDADYQNYVGPGIRVKFADIVKMDTSGADNDAVVDILDKGYLTADEEVQYAVQGLGTDEDKLKEVFKGKSLEEIKAIAEAWAKKHPADEGDTRTPYERFKDRIGEELSGRDYFDIMDVVEHGDAQTPEEQAKKGHRRVAFEARSSNWFATEQLDSLQRSADMLDADVAALRDVEAKRPKPGDKDYTPAKLREWDDKWEEKNAAVDAQVENVDRAVENHRHSVDEITDTIVTIVTIVVLVIITVVVAIFTAGAGLAAIGAALASTEFLVGTALATAAATIATKAILKGDAYGWEDMGVDATVGIIDAMSAKFTAGMGSKLLKLGFLARMAEEGGVFARMAAHGIAQGAEGFVQGLPSALAGNVLNDANYRPGGNALLNILGGTATQAGMSGLMAGSLGMLGGVGRPKHMVTPKELAEFKLHPENQAKLFAAYKEKLPGATHEQFMRAMDEAVLKGKPDIFMSDTVQRAMKQQLLEHMGEEARKAFKDMPIEVVSAADFKKLTGSETGQAVTMFRRGKPSIVVKAGADLSVLGEEGIHLLQASDKHTADLVKSLDETALKKWKTLPPEKKVELYRNKLRVEIEAHERLISSLEAKKGASLEAGSATRQIERAERTLEQLRARMGEVNALKPAELADLAKSGRPPYLQDPPRLFSKDPKSPALVPGAEAHGAPKEPPAGVHGPPKETPAPPPHVGEKPPVHVPEEPPHLPEAGAKPEVEAKAHAEAEARAKADADAKAKADADAKAKADADAKAKADADAKAKADGEAAETARKADLEKKAKEAELEATQKRDIADQRQKDVEAAQAIVDDLEKKKVAAQAEATEARRVRDQLQEDLKGQRGDARKPHKDAVDAAAELRKAEVAANEAYSKAEEALRKAKADARAATKAAKDAEEAARAAQRAIKEPTNLEFGEPPNRGEKKIKDLEARELSPEDALDSSFGGAIDPAKNGKVRQVGKAWKEGGTIYRIVELVEEGEDGIARIVEIHEEKFAQSGWRKRGREAVRAGAHAERASHAMTIEKIGKEHLANAGALEKGAKGLPEGVSWVKFDVQTPRGHGFDEMLVHFEGQPPTATVHPTEVKHYQGHVPASEFTATGRKLEANLNNFRDALEKSHLPEPYKQAVRDALDSWRIQIDVRLGPASVLSTDARAAIERTANLWRGGAVATGELRVLEKANKLTPALIDARTKLDEAIGKFKAAMAVPHADAATKSAAKAAENELEAELKKLATLGVDVNASGLQKVKIGESERIGLKYLKEAEDPGDFLRTRIGEPAAPTKTGGSTGGSPGGEGGAAAPLSTGTVKEPAQPPPASSATPQPTGATVTPAHDASVVASDPARIKAVADQAIEKALVAERIRVRTPGGPVLGWGGFDVSTSLMWSKRRFKPFEIAQLEQLRTRLTSIPELDPARYAALSMADKKAAIVRSVEATMEVLGIPKSRRPVVQFQNLPAGDFGWMDWRFNPAGGGQRLSPATKRGVIVISENLGVGDAVGTAVHEGRHYYQAYQAYMESVGRKQIHPFAAEWRGNLPGSGGVYHGGGPQYFTQPIERDAESFGRRLIDLFPARWPSP
jgi:hypothetical protein